MPTRLPSDGKPEVQSTERAARGKVGTPTTGTKNRKRTDDPGSAVEKNPSPTGIVRCMARLDPDPGEIVVTCCICPNRCGRKGCAWHGIFGPGPR